MRAALEQLETLDPALSEKVDEASRLFFEFAAPVLLAARNDEEFQTASALAEFVWAATEFDTPTQALMLDDFISETNVPPHLIPWLIDVYGELAARKAELLGW